MPNVSWEDIGGLENVKRELQEVILVLDTVCSRVCKMKFLFYHVGSLVH